MTDPIGRPLDRVTGPAKVTGATRYAADQAVPNPLYAHLVVSTVGLGTIAAVDDAAARAIPGVREVYTHRNQPSITAAPFFGSGGQAQQSWQPLAGPDVRFYGEIVGMVVAETILDAREAAAALRFTYDAREPAAVIGAPGITREERPEKAINVGDAERGLAEAAVTVSHRYETAANTHNPIELFSTTAVWNDDRLTVYVPSQWVKGFQVGLAQELGIDEGRVRIVSPYVGGGFGSKGTLFTWVALVAAAARQLKRPVKLYVTREQGFTVASFRSETEQEVALGASSDGVIDTLVQRGLELQSRADAFIVNGAEVTTRMYRAENIATSVAIARADRQTPGFMRAPPEAPYFFAFESAIDELAHELAIDPVELRIRNDTQTDPVKGVPFTTRSLVECFEAGGEAFGWANYDPTVGALREGDELIGWGVATATYPTHMMPCAARVHIDTNGEVLVQVASHEQGVGSYTVFAQAAAERLRVPVERVRVELGDSQLPPGSIAGGSNQTASNVSTIMVACDRILERIGAASEDADTMAALNDYSATAVEEYVEWVPTGLPDSARSILREAGVRFAGGAGDEYAKFAFGAEFVEVRVNRFTREIRVPRIVGAFAAGRIMNEKTARSQYIGGMVWGIGHALHEVSEVDARTGAYMNDNLGEYLVPVCADIREIEAILVPEVDTLVNPAGVKGIGEIGIVGTAAAIANAVYHATGIRVRKAPIRIEDVVPSA